MVNVGPDLPNMNTCGQKGHTSYSHWETSYATSDEMRRIFMRTLRQSTNWCPFFCCCSFGQQVWGKFLKWWHLQLTMCHTVNVQCHHFETCATVAMPSKDRKAFYSAEGCKYKPQAAQPTSFCSLRSLRFILASFCCWKSLASYPCVHTLADNIWLSTAIGLQKLSVTALFHYGYHMIVTPPCKIHDWKPFSHMKVCWANNTYDSCLFTATDYINQMGILTK